MRETREDYYEVSVEVRGEEPSFWYTIKLPVVVDETASARYDLEAYAWYSILVALNDRHDVADMYAVRESMKIEQVCVRTTVERWRVL